jgi:hypothetical protein
MEARKGRGRLHEFTADERNWIDQTTKCLIRRAAEVAYDPNASAVQITMASLPNVSAGAIIPHLKRPGIPVAPE